MSVSVLGDISKDGNKGLVWSEFESHGGGLEAYTDHDQWGYIGLTLKRLYKADLLHTNQWEPCHPEQVHNFKTNSKTYVM